MTSDIAEILDLVRDVASGIDSGRNLAKRAKLLMKEHTEMFEELEDLERAGDREAMAEQRADDERGRDDTE